MKHRLMQVLSLVLALVLLFGSIPTAFAETPEIPVETEPPYTGVETDTGQVPPVTEETTPPTEPEASEPPAETTAPPQTEEPPVTEAPTEVTEPPEQEAPPTTEQDFELDIGDVLVPTTVGDSQVVPMTLPGGTDLTIVSKDFYAPAGGYVSFRWYSDLEPYPIGPYFTYTATIFHLSNGRIGFCLQPMLSGGGSYEATVPGGSHIDSDGWPNAIYKSSNGTWISWKIDYTSKMGIFRAMAYGAPNNGDTSDAGIKATALCVWDMVTGHRNVDGTPRNGNPPFYSTISDPAIKAKYDQLLAKLAKHDLAPSFTAPQPSLINSASTITLKKDANTGLYTGSAVDKNGVLEDYHFTSNIQGLTFTRSGNTLKVTATEAAARQLNQLVIRSRGHELGEGTKACTVYQDKSSPNTRQKLVVLDGPVDPVPCCFRLAVELEGQIQVKKTTNTGQNLSGWKFEIVDKATNKVVQTVTTDSKGLATATKLPAGEYIVREVGGGNAYWQLDTSGHTVTVVAGQTATVTVNNVHRGRIVVQKNAINGSAEGWRFEIWQGDAWIETITTGADGKATSSYLLPGNYTVREFHDQWMDRYWEYDVNVEQNATVVAGQDTNLTYTNIQYGRIVVQKNAINGSAEGWNFEIWQGDAWIETITTGPDGTATSSKLLPGNYTVREFHDQWMDRYWEYDVNVEQNATVTAGQDTTLTYTNIQYGRIVVQKNAINGSAEGWNFEIWQGDAWIETITTGPDGTATSSKLLPGNYTVREFHDQWMDRYWEYDVNVEQNATVTAGQDTTLTYTNTQYGRLQIVKTMADGTSPAGWVFRVTDSTGQEVPGSPFTTGEDGVILSGKLAPGTYTVEEIIPEDSLYFCDSENPQTVVVTAGATASVSFTNALRPGKINIQKVDTLGNPLSGAVFLLEWSTDGKIWNPIVYSESIQAGGCSNPNVVDGCITTGEDGLASWENLHPGLYYRVTEVKAPGGYQLLTEPVFTGKLPIEDLTVSLRVVNAPIFTLPQTGGMGFDGFTAGIILSLSACLGALFFMLSAGKKSRLFSYQKQERKGFKMKKFFALMMTLVLLLSGIPTAFAADAADATIDTDASCSLTIFKYDWTNAVKDGVWNEDSFISTGWRESYVEDVLGNAVRQGDADGSTGNDLGNGQNSNGYALKGVEFTTLKVADIVTFTESANDQHPDYNLTQVLYGFHKVKAADLLAAIGLADGAGRYTNADNTDKLSKDNYYYTSETLNKALAAALAANATTVKDALETYMAAQDGAIVMAKTDENGKTIQRNLPVGLYLCVETAVPEMVTSTTNPFFVSLPMTTVSGDENSASPEGGHAWNYDVVVYPKNETGIPTLEKTVREAKKDTGKNEGTSTITDGFAHTATGSSGDVMEYQVISTLPTITSQATALTVYNFYDTLCEGLSYNKSLRDVKIEFFTDKDCTDKVASWDMDSGKFTVTYSSDDRHMTVDVTAAGLAEINGDTENVNGQLYAGYSNYTIRVTYTATIDSDASVVFGDNGNDNQVVLTWKRTSTEYYDTLIDDCHVFTFGIDLTKLFSDVDSETAEEQGMFDHVKFKIWNETDGYWVTATRNDEEGVYYVTGHVTDETDATIFHPVTMGEALGQIMVKGCEDDEYIITEVETANGYTLLKDDIHVVISTQIDNSRPCDIYTQDVLGVLQNDPHYSFDGNLNLHLANIPQKQLAHDYLTASATVDGNAVTMLEDNGSANAEAPLTVVNTPGFDLPQTGGYGTTIFTVTGIVVMALAAGVTLWLLFGKRKKENA